MSASTSRPLPRRVLNRLLYLKPAEVLSEKLFRMKGISSETRPLELPLRSVPCSQAALESPEFRAWAERMHERFHYHRKLWEFCYIAQALYERGCLREGIQGLGFAVGREPLPSLFASLGCKILATDLAPDDAGAAAWQETNQHMSGDASLNSRGICDPERFAELVQARYVDMNAIPADLRQGQFDFIWSSCSLEHLGSRKLGFEYIWNSLECLKPGGFAVHTTEFNLTSSWLTLDYTGSVVFTARDFEKLARALNAAGHSIDLDLRLPMGPKDRYMDPPPYPPDAPHLHMMLGAILFTSTGLIIQKAK